MVQPFDAVIFDPKVPLNTVQGPVLTQFGAHLIMVHEREEDEDEEKKEANKH